MADLRLWSRFIPLLVVLTTLPALADEGKELFEKQCASCHTIGGGDSGGPDLKGVGAKRPGDWLMRVIVEPDKLAADKDPAQLELVKKYGFEMPNLGISRDDARKIVAYLKGQAPPAKAPAGAGRTVEAPAAPGHEPVAGAAVPGDVKAPDEAKKEAVAATPDLIARGKALFTGEKPFAKGGAPCIACHAFTYPGVTGGSLAADLTYIYEGVGEQGMKGVLKALKFPIMKKIYADRSLTDDEIAALIVFAKDASARKGGEGSRFFPAAGAVILVVLLIGLSFYKRRIR